MNNHNITQNTVRFYVFWGIKNGLAHLNRALGTYDVRKGVYRRSANDESPLWSFFSAPPPPSHPLSE